MLYNSGKALIQGFWDGIKDVWAKMTGWVEDNMSDLRDLWPFSPAKRGPFSGKGYTLYSGRALMEDFAGGMADRTDEVRRAAEAAMEMAARTLPTDYSATVRSSQEGAALTGFAGAGMPASSSTSDSRTYGDVTIKVALDDLKSVKDLDELWEWIDNLRNNSRRGLEVTAA